MDKYKKGDIIHWNEDNNIHEGVIIDLPNNDVWVKVKDKFENVCYILSNHIIDDKKYKELKEKEDYKQFWTKEHIEEFAIFIQDMILSHRPTLYCEHILENEESYDIKFELEKFLKNKM